MADLLWSFEQLARYTRFEDPEVRYWAADRLTHLYPDSASDAVASLLFDDHDSTPFLVASHLGEHGSLSHAPALVGGFRKTSGALPGHCLAALARLGYADAPSMAREALHRRDLNEEALAQMVAGLADMAASAGSEDAADAAREIVLRRQELYADPLALQGCFKIFGDDGLGDLAAKWITALHFKGLDAAEPGIRAIEENLQLEDVSWCLRTDRAGRVDLDRSLRAVENGFDCEVRGLIAGSDRAALAAAFVGGEFREMAATLASLVESRAREVAADPADALPRRIAAFASGFRRDVVLTEAERLGHPMHTWIMSLLLSALFKTAGYRNFDLECDRAAGDLDALLRLAETETAFLSRRLPPMLAEAAGESGRERLEQWCAATLEARGPFFPKVTALSTVGEARLTGQIPLVLESLSDDNGYIYGAAEKALARLGDLALEAARSEIEARRMHPDAMHSVLVAASDVMTPAALGLVLDHFDDFMETAGPEEAAEHVSVFGAKESIPHLRRWLKRSQGATPRIATEARVGHALLLAGAIHNVPIPEEERILQAIDEYWKQSPEEGPSGGSGASGPYLM